MTKKEKLAILTRDLKSIAADSVAADHYEVTEATIAAIHAVDRVRASLAHYGADSEKFGPII